MKKQITVLLTVIMLLSMVLSGCSTEQKAERQLSQIEKYVEKGKVEKIINLTYSDYDDTVRTAAVSELPSMYSDADEEEKRLIVERLEAMLNGSPATKKGEDAETPDSTAVISSVVSAITDVYNISMPKKSDKEYKESLESMYDLIQNGKTSDIKMLAFNSYLTLNGLNDSVEPFVLLLDTKDDAIRSAALENVVVAWSETDYDVDSAIHDTALLDPNSSNEASKSFGELVVTGFMLDIYDVDEISAYYEIDETNAKSIIEENLGENERFVAGAIDANINDSSHEKYKELIVCIDENIVKEYVINDVMDGKTEGLYLVKDSLTENDFNKIKSVLFENLDENSEYYDILFDKLSEEELDTVLESTSEQYNKMSGNTALGVFIAEQINEKGFDQNENMAYVLLSGIYAAPDYVEGSNVSSKWEKTGEAELERLRSGEAEFEPLFYKAMEKAVELEVPQVLELGIYTLNLMQNPVDTVMSSSFEKTKAKGELYACLMSEIDNKGDYSDISSYFIYNYSDKIYERALNSISTSSLSNASVNNSVNPDSRRVLAIYKESNGFDLRYLDVIPYNCLAFTEEQARYIIRITHEYVFAFNYYAGSREVPGYRMDSKVEVIDKTTGNIVSTSTVRGLDLPSSFVGYTTTNVHYGDPNLSGIQSKVVSLAYGLRK